LPLTGATVLDRSTGGLATAVKASSGQKDRALFITWGIMGLWHGANWTFVFWGIYHAFVIYFYRKLSPLFKNVPEKIAHLGGWILTLPIMMLSWIPFRAANLTDTFEMYKKILNPSMYSWLGLRENCYLIAVLILVSVVLLYLIKTQVIPRLRKHRFILVMGETLAFTFILSLVFIFLRPIKQFIYFQF
jgi:hypothetical protein